MPIYASTGSRYQAMKWCLLSSICEPAAAIIFGFLFHQYLTRSIMSSLNAVGSFGFSCVIRPGGVSNAPSGFVGAVARVRAVAGIMIMLCIVELIPATLQHVSGKAAAASNLVGQVIMFLSLHFLIQVRSECS